MNIDYIIVGFGLAGLAFAEQLENYNKSYLVFEDNSQNSSLVAGGVYNPVILKRFTPVWDAIDQIKIAIPFYKELEEKLDAKFNYTFDIHRIFTSVEEQNNWFNACDKPFLADYMIPEIIQNTNDSVIAPFGFGKITNTGKIDTKFLLKRYKEYLINKNQLRYEKFDYSLIEFDSELVTYKDIRAKYIVFCEGFGVKKNPFFKELPLQEAKGELLTIHAPELKIDYLLKSSIFIMPLDNDYYKVGATFNWTDKTMLPTEEGENELLVKLKRVITVDFEVVEHVAGIRPTVKDRRPLIGKHQQYKQLAILNGLGTRGIMLAPKMAKKLFDHLEHDSPLDKEVNITRFN
ncbi:MAG: FAD-binding oxidoreductase [Flavobacteriaceae bacterium]|nr:FAD-binding oxidoreductase [Flavobacteriaceae bacterium]